MAKTEKEMKSLAAISITLFAALLAINTLLGGANSSKILNNTVAANNQWAWYQAKNVRAVIYETHGKHEDAQRMEKDKTEIMAQAKALEAERDEAKKRSPYYTYAGSLLQIAIVLSTAAILAVAMPLYWASLVVGAGGALLFANAYFLFL